LYLKSWVNKFNFKVITVTKLIHLLVPKFSFISISNGKGSTLKGTFDIDTANFSFFEFLRKRQRKKKEGVSDSNLFSSNFETDGTFNVTQSRSSVEFVLSRIREKATIDSVYLSILSHCWQLSILVLSLLSAVTS
jgi:hypothetical protein